VGIKRRDVYKSQPYSFANDARSRRVIRSMAVVGCKAATSAQSIGDDACES
jgi:hypothetical protein